MKSLNVSYVMYFNTKYKRVGHLFQDRYKSEIVDDDIYLLELSKYIHNNPVKAGIIKHVMRYQWSSCRQYVDGDFCDKRDLVSVSKILGLLSNEYSVAQKEYYRYITNSEEYTKLALKSGFISAEEENRKYLSLINDAEEKIVNLAEKRGLTVEELTKNREARDEVIRELRKNTSLKLKEIGQLLGGLSESRVSRILKT